MFNAIDIYQPCIAMRSVRTKKFIGILHYKWHKSFQKVSVKSEITIEYKTMSDDNVLP